MTDKKEIHTDGGMAIEGGVATNGGDFVGRDQKSYAKTHIDHSNTTISHGSPLLTIAVIVAVLFLGIIGILAVMNLAPQQPPPTPTPATTPSTQTETTGGVVLIASSTPVTATTAPTMTSTKITTANIKLTPPTQLNTPTSTPTMTATFTPSATLTAISSTAPMTPLPASAYPCPAETFLPSKTMIVLRSTPSGGSGGSVPVGVSVLVMRKHQGNNLYEILYAEKTRGWIGAENLILADLCPK